MEKKNKTLLVIVGVLLVIGIGASLAYFIVSVNITGSGSKTNLSTGNVPLVEYDAGTNTLSSNNLIPTGIISKDFKVTVTPTTDIKEVTYRIFINITENTFTKCTENNYEEIANECELNAEELVYRLKDSSGNIIRQGDLTGLTGEIEIARETKMQEIKTEYNYTIEIEFKDTGKAQNHNANKVFNGNINVEFAEKPIAIDDIIASSNASSSTPDFSKTATTDEGVFKTSDGMYGGTTYYWRGAATTNHVIFANKCWRIVRINGDKTMRLIYNGTVQSGNTCTGNGSNTGATIAEGVYSTNGHRDNSSYVGWTYSLGSQRTLSGTSSNAKTKTEKWYSSNIIGTNSEKVADGKFCNDRNVKSGQSWVVAGTSFQYAGYERLYDNNTPTFNCANTGDVYTLKAGAITADEVAFAGGVYGINNSSYYMYTGQYYWTMSPFDFSDDNAHVFFVNSKGLLDDISVNWNGAGLRPVINLKSNTEFEKGGEGTAIKPYEVL